MADKYEDIANATIAAVGGPSNVKAYTNCMTRLRITPVDASLIDDAAVKKIPGVLGTVTGDQYQVILGPGAVTKVAEHVGRLTAGAAPVVATTAVAAAPAVNDVYYEDLGRPAVSATSAEALQARGAELKAAQKAKNDTPFKNFLRHIGNIFVPLIPAFVGAGLIGGIANIIMNLSTAGHITSPFWLTLRVVLGVMQNALFSYLMIYIGINAAREFGATPALGGLIAGITLLNGVTPAAVGTACAPDAVTCLTNPFTGTALQSGYGGVLGVLLAVWILSVVEKFLRRFIPDALDMILTPLIAVLVVGLVTIFLIMPIAGAISSALVGFINWIINIGGAVAGFVLGGLFLPLVMLGVHQILTPIHLEMINANPSVGTTLLPMLAMAGAGQVGAALALWARCRRNRSLTNMIKGALPVGFLGIGEPLIYGVTLPLGRPFVTACIGGAFGGAAIGLLGQLAHQPIGATVVGPSGIALLPLITGGIWRYIIGLLVGYAAGFLITYFFGVPKEAMYGDDAVDEAVARTNADAAYAGEPSLVN